MPTTADPISDVDLDNLAMDEKAEEDDTGDSDGFELASDTEPEPEPPHPADRLVLYLPLSAKAQFDALPHEQKLYAHHLARAAWAGAPIILRQVSRESPDIFRFILQTYHVCRGDWDKYVQDGNVTRTELDEWLEYAARFLSNLGNYFGYGDVKFIPSVPPEALDRLAGDSALYQHIREPLFDVNPGSMGFPSARLFQSQYYPSDLPISEDEVAAVSRALSERKIFPENTRIEKSPTGYIIHIASVDQNPSGLQPFALTGTGTDKTVEILYGDHANDLGRVAEQILKARDSASNPTQEEYLSELAASFKNGDLETYRNSLRRWVRDESPRVESIFGFVEPYRDPHGVRAEFEGVVAITDSSDSEFLKKLVGQSDVFIRKLPWTAPDINGGKGHFEKIIFEPPDFTSIRTIAYCSSTYFSGINLPNYDDIRERCGFKNVIVTNVMGALDGLVMPSTLLPPEEREKFSRLKNRLRLQHTMLHELLGHGTSILLAEDADGNCNFDKENPPIDPLTGRPINKWYGPGETWFGRCNIAMTADECRADLVSAVLVDDSDVLALFGWTADGEFTNDDIIFGLYQLLVVEGLSSVNDYNVSTQSWMHAHSRARFAIFKALLRAGVVRVHCDADATIQAHIDQSKILSHGKPALSDMLLRLHMYRCTGDGGACRAYYDEMTTPEDDMLRWGNAIADDDVPEWLCVQPNTFQTEDGSIELKEYELSAKGVIQSWYERVDHLEDLR